MADKLCECGTNHQAMDAAERSYLQHMRSGDCVIWRLAQIIIDTRFLSRDFIRDQKNKHPTMTDDQATQEFAECMVAVSFSLAPELRDQLVDERIQKLIAKL